MVTLMKIDNKKTWHRIKIHIRNITHFESILEILNTEVGKGSKNWVINKPVRKFMHYRPRSTQLHRTVVIRESYDAIDALHTKLMLM